MWWEIEMNNFIHSELAEQPKKKNYHQNELFASLSNVEKREVKENLLNLMKQHPQLCFEGYGITERCCTRINDRKKGISYEQTLKRDRNCLIGAVVEFYAACVWIKDNLRPIKTCNRELHSYRLKHIIEEETYYISSGTFTAAALHCGYKMFQQGINDNHPCWNISEISVLEAVNRREEQPTDILGNHLSEKDFGMRHSRAKKFCKKYWYKLNAEHKYYAMLEAQRKTKT